MDTTRAYSTDPRDAERRAQEGTTVPKVCEHTLDKTDSSEHASWALDPCTYSISRQRVGHTGAKKKRSLRDGTGVRWGQQVWNMRCCVELAGAVHRVLEGLRVLDRDSRCQVRF